MEKVLKILALCVIALNGLGFAALYYIGFLLLYLSWGLNLSSDKRSHQIFYFIALLLFAYFPELTQISSLSICFALALKQYRSACALVIIAFFNAKGLWYQDYSLLILAILSLSIPYLIKKDYLFISAKYLSITYLFFNIYNIFVHPGITIPESQKYDIPYQIGGNFYKLGINASPGGVIAAQFKNKSEGIKGTIYGEHDDFLLGEKVLGKNNYMQKSRWFGKQYLAPELVRYSLALDGFHIANYGMELACSGNNFLSHQYMQKVFPIVIISKGKLITGDTDCFVNRISPYQRFFLLSCSQGSPFNKNIVITAYAFLILSIFFERRAIIVSLLSVYLLFLIISNNYLPIGGDVRFIGKKSGWPHTERHYGMVRYFQDNNKNYIFGTTGTKVLVVSKDFSAKIKDSEKVIILGSNSRLSTKEGDFKVGNIPMGEKNGIINTFEIFGPNKENMGVGLVKHKINDIIRTIIATDSPTEIPIELFE